MDRKLNKLLRIRKKSARLWQYFVNLRVHFAAGLLLECAAVPNPESHRRYSYCAFISYSHLDRNIADRLHRSLENYVVPPELVGRNTVKGRIPRRLGAVFMDQVELAAGPLSTQIRIALQEAEHLIVICSPNSRHSSYVAQEIEEFKRLGRADRILALVVGDDDHESVANCFPEALNSVQCDESQARQSGNADIIAANLMNDGWRLAKQKLVAAILAVSLDELRRRDITAERRQRRMWTAIALAMSALAIVTAVLAVFANQQRDFATASRRLAEERLHQSTEIALSFSKLIARATTNYEIPTSNAYTLLHKSEKIFDDLLKVAGNKEQELRIAAEMNLYFAQTVGRLHNAIDKENRAKKAKSAYEQLRSLAPRKAEYKKGLADASYQLAFALRDQGYLAAALAEFERASILRNELYIANPHSTSAANDVAAVLLQIGRTQKRQGQVQAALHNISASLNLRTKIFVVDLDRKVDAKLNVTIARVEYADALGLQGNVRRRIEILRDVVRDRRALHHLALSDTKTKRFLAWGLIFYGEALLEAGETEEALKANREARDLMRDVWAADRASIVAKKDMTWAEGHLGDVLLAVDKYDDALMGYQKSLDIAENQLKTNEISLGNRRNVAYWLVRRSRALSKKGLAEQAMRDLNRAASFLRMDVLVDASNRQLRSELGFLYLEIARLASHTKRIGLSLRCFNEAKELYETIASEAAEAKTWARMADVARQNRFDLEKQTSDAFRPGSTSRIKGWQQSLPSLDCSPITQ